MKMIATAILLGGTVLGAGAMAMDAPLRPDQTEFRGLYKELVETNRMAVAIIFIGLS